MPELQYSQSFASTLLTATPTNATSCDALIAVAEPLEATAANGFAVCLAKSTELGWFGDSSRLCERELNRLRPAEFPLATELRRRPLAVGVITDIEPQLRWSPPLP